MEREQRPTNPYELLTPEELDSITAQLQEHQRELTIEYEMAQAARLKLYTERLRHE